MNFRVAPIFQNELRKMTSSRYKFKFSNDVMKLCTKVRLYVQFEYTLPTLDKSFYLKSYCRLRNCPMCEIAPLSPILYRRIILDSLCRFHIR